MKKNIKNLLIATLLVSMVGGFTGCSKSKPSNTTANNKPQQEKQVQFADEEKKAQVQFSDEEKKAGEEIKKENKIMLEMIHDFVKNFSTYTPDNIEKQVKVVNSYSMVPSYGILGDAAIAQVKQTGEICKFTSFEPEEIGYSKTVAYAGNGQTYDAVLVSGVLKYSSSTDGKSSEIKQYIYVAKDEKDNKWKVLSIQDKE